MKDTFKMVGHYVAHAVWSISDGEVLIPMLAALGRDGQIAMQRFPDLDPATMLAWAKQQLDENASDHLGAAFIWDGYITLDTKTEALLLEVRGYGDAAFSCSIAVPYRRDPEAGTFHISRPKLFGKLDAVPEVMEAFFEGVENHEPAYPVWSAALGQGYVVDRDPAATRMADPSAGAEAYRCLVRTPLLVFLAVSAADGNIDAKEIQSFKKIISNPSKFPSGLMQRVLPETAGNLEGLMKITATEGFDFLAELKKGAAVAESLVDADESLRFRQSLLLIGKQVAEASGGGFLGFGNKIDENEKRALAAIAVALNLL